MTNELERVARRLAVQRRIDTYIEVLLTGPLQLHGNVLRSTYSRGMSRSGTVDVQALAVKIVRRHSLPPSIPRRWDLPSRWRQRRYESQLVGVPLRQLRQAVARAERSGVTYPVVKS